MISEKRIAELERRVEALEGLLNGGTLMVEPSGGLLRIVGDGFDNQQYVSLLKVETRTDT